MKYKISIIIPIYNAEKYIEECLESIFGQLPVQVEIILINDGTPDKSIDIVKSKYDSWLSKDQIVLLEQENAGPGAARNSGLAIARGEYIGFLDSDDIIFENYFSLLIETIRTSQTDIVEFGFQRFNELQDISRDEYKSLYDFSGQHNIKDIRSKIFSVGLWFPWTRIYVKKLFDDIQFPVDVFYEDLMTIPSIYFQDLSIYLIDQPLIGYRFNPNSTTSIHNVSHTNDMYEYYVSLEKLDETIPREILKIKIARSIAYFFNELQSEDIPITEVMDDINKVSKRFDLLKTLKLPDLFFFIFPKTYMIIDRFRLKRQKVKNED